MDQDFATAYAKLRRIAQTLMKRERCNHTFTATDVVHEAFARLLTSKTPPQGALTVDFVRNVSRAMTEVLIDRARAKGALKRRGTRARVRLEDLEDFEATLDTTSMDWGTLDSALEDLAAIDSKLHSIVVLRFFGGLEWQAIARLVGRDERTARRNWLGAKLWLKKRLGKD